jgi:UDP-4-amino-4,6-dideoxy-N-acetyl-beta-L-altrosamine transaminase
MIPYGRQTISENDIDAVVKVLRSDFLTQGPKVPEFESALCGITGASHAIAMNSATSALHAACLALGVGPNDRLWTSPNTFVASANCGVYCGAAVDFIDIDPATFNLSVNHLEKKLAVAATNDTLPKVVIPVHFGGNPCAMARIKELSKTYKFRIIEDASHAIGATQDNAAIGSCKYSDITIFSFHPVKIITSGEGGAALTNDQALATRLSSLRSHGITRDVSSFKNPNHEAWYYEQLTIGFNYRMNDLEAALGLSQLDSLSSFINRRIKIAEHYSSLLDKKLICPQKITESSRSAWHLYVVRLKSTDFEARNRIFRNMRDAGIGVNLHYIPVHLQPFYQKMGFKKDDFPEVEQYYNECITLPIHPSLGDSEVEYIATTLNNIAA